MSTVIDPMRATISLHGLGFIQVQLQGDLRLHVWHPILPRRACFEHSAIHDHRFGFVSRVLIGTQRNIEYRAEHRADGTHMTYLHEGPRTPRGGRPWKADGRINLIEDSIEDIPAGDSYVMKPYRYHQTQPLGDGRVATLMKKTSEVPYGARSTCTYGVQPDVDFDRFQWPALRLWAVVLDVLGSGSLVAESNQWALQEEARA
ncbi:hypothetical protein [Pseudomonas indica]|uniref:Uncharacterized protein n=1 Tax=Pseudomonas indica TaxID=137658 RepID=A0A1G8V1S0_9PSED|nr:hypothetical protein [Pseudomonas indica]SDJ59991.1 hypothetical protein SAMN05216186_10269 [Pseudomonas indica]